MLVGFLLVADALTLGALLVVRPGGWLPPFVAFGLLLLGLVAFELWSIRHRHDD